MTSVIVEREFAEPVAFESIQEIEDRGSWCLDMHQVRFVRSWFAADRRRMICQYEAPDAESVRIAQHQAAMPVTRVWACRPVAPPATAGDDPQDAGGRARDASPSAGPPALETVLVQREFEHPLEPDAVAAMLACGEECLPRYNTTYRGGFLSSDGLRMICLFLAPDAESVRIVNRTAGIPFRRAWAATVHPPPGA